MKMRRVISSASKRSDIEREVYMKVFQTLKACNIKHANLPGLTCVIVDNLLLENINFVKSDIPTTRGIDYENSLTHEFA